MLAGKRNGLRIRLVAVSTLIPSACGCQLGQWAENGFKLGPNYQRPEAAVADAWLESNDSQLSAQPPDYSDWWAVFDDPVLSKLVGTAAAQNLTLREAGFRVLQARADRDIAIGNLFPQQQFGSGSFFWDQVSENAGGPESEPTARTKIANGLGALVNPPGYLLEQWAGGPGLDATFRNWQFGASTSWELDVWGRFRRAVESADANLEASVQSYRALLVSLIAEVATAYVDVRTSQAQLEFARHNVEIQEQSLKLTETQAREGKTSQVGVYLARSNLESTRAVIPVLQISLSQANNRLCTLLGMPPTDLVAQWDQGGIPAAPTQITVGMPADLLRRRPDVQEAERLLAAQSEQIGIAEAELYPQFVLTGSIGLEAEHFSKLFHGNSFFYNTGPSFTWNILNYGRLINNVRFQESRFQELVAGYQNTVLNANQEVEDALVAYLRTQERLQSLSDSVQATQEALDLVLIQFREGQIDFTAVFVLQGELTLAQDQLAAAQGSVILNLIDVYRALGGGWEYFVGAEPEQHSADGYTAGALQTTVPAMTQPNEELDEPN